MRGLMKKPDEEDEPKGTEEADDVETDEGEEPAGDDNAEGGAPTPPAESSGDQAIYDTFVRNGMRIIYDRKALQSVLKSLDGNGQPVAGMANTIGGVVSRLLQSAEQSGQKIPPNVVLHGAGELVQQLADLSEQSGGHKFTDEEMQSVIKVLLQAGMKGAEEQQQQQQQPPAGAAPPGGAPPPAGGAQPGLMA